MSADRIDVLAVMANPRGFRATGRWGTGDVASALRLRGHKVATSRVLAALRREEQAARVVCLGPRNSDGEWHGNNITRCEELIWRLSDEYAAAHGNESCRAALAERAALARVGGAP